MRGRPSARFAAPRAGFRACPDVAARARVDILQLDEAVGRCTLTAIDVFRPAISPLIATATAAGVPRKGERAEVACQARRDAVDRPRNSALTGACASKPQRQRVDHDASGTGGAIAIRAPRVIVRSLIATLARLSPAGPPCFRRRELPVLPVLVRLKHDDRSTRSGDEIEMATATAATRPAPDRLRQSMSGVFAHRAVEATSLTTSLGSRPSLSSMPPPIARSRPVADLMRAWMGPMNWLGSTVQTAIATPRSNSRTTPPAIPRIVRVVRIARF